MQVKNAIVSFEWDNGNLDKSYSKHGILPKEMEEVFIDEESIVLPDVKHSQKEARYIIVSRSLSKLYLFVVFTFRRNMVRVISARKMHREEVERYEKIKKIPTFKTEKEERLFWQKANSFDYVDWGKAEHWQFPNLKLTSVPITMRIPASLLDRVKIRAHQKDMSYQTLMKQFIYDAMASFR